MRFRKRLIAAGLLAAALVPAASTPAAAAPTLSNTLCGWLPLTAGATGRNVTSAQFLLAAAGELPATAQPTGSYDAATVRAVKFLQFHHQIKIDGVLGPSTWDALAVTVGKTSDGPAVKAVQVELGLAVTGTYDSATEQAIKTFQADPAIDLPADGVVEGRTWRELVERGTDSVCSWPIRKEGASDASVSAAQFLLTAAGASIPAAGDGKFGPETTAALKTFQAAHGLPADGTLNAHTWDALLVTVRSNDTGDAVKAVQEELLNNGYEVFESPGIDAGTGVYDAGTEAVVKRFQTHFDLAVTGVVDAATWRTLAATGT
ncbi:hypothetical protein GCM10009765_41960 [Fodinicola feengrottensis]|uniref:Peptidoglycan binding-like domain-containing protein n=1 Tax=Fodinicola feengrottensis TaxID=435914 RepID=A0ABP4TH95_9ACTN